MNVKHIIQNPKSEHAVKGLKAIISTISTASGFPIGGVLNSLMNDYLPDYKIERLTKLVEEISKELKEFKGEIDDDYITSEGFGYLFETTMKKATTEYRQEKLEAYKNFLLNSMIQDDITDSKKEYILYLIEELHYSHIAFLHIFYCSKSFEIEDTGKIDNTKITRYLSETYGIPEYLWEIQMRQLEQKGLLLEGALHMTFNESDPKDDLRDIDDHKTKIGQELYDFIKDS